MDGFYCSPPVHLPYHETRLRIYCVTGSNLVTSSFLPQESYGDCAVRSGTSFLRFSIFVVLLVFKQECSKDTARFVMHLLCLCDTVDSFAVRLQKFLEGFTKSTKNVTQDILTRTRNWIHSN